jgi:endonuclease G
VRLSLLVETVEKAAGLQLFNDDLKRKSRQLCTVTQCQLVIRRFDDARKQVGGKGGKGGGR